MSIEVKNISKYYGEQKAVDDISFKIKAGEVVGFLGPNGAGKSTTMKIITTFIPQSLGHATVCGFDTVEQSMEVRRNIGYLPENNPLYPDMYVKEYLEFVAGTHKMGKEKVSRIEEMIEKTGLTLERKKKIGQLSKGYRQRVGLAQAMLHDPQVLILDEPTSGLDPNQLVEIRNLIKNLGKQKTVILSTHIMQEVQALCSRVIIINQGKIVADDKTEKLQHGGAAEQIIIVEFAETVKIEQLKGIAGIQNVKEAGANKWILTSASKDDIRPVIFEFASKNNLTLLTINKESQSLEEVFKKLTKK